MWTELNIVTEKAGRWTWLSMLGGQIVEEIGLVEKQAIQCKLRM
jgi:hypothetical protein